MEIEPKVVRRVRALKLLMAPPDPGVLDPEHPGEYVARVLSIGPDLEVAADELSAVDGELEHLPWTAPPGSERVQVLTPGIRLIQIPLEPPPPASTAAALPDLPAGTCCPHYAEWNPDESLCPAIPPYEPIAGWKCRFSRDHAEDHFWLVHRPAEPAASWPSTQASGPADGTDARPKAIAEETPPDEGRVDKHAEDAEELCPFCLNVLAQGKPCQRHPKPKISSDMAIECSMAYLDALNCEKSPKPRHMLETSCALNKTGIRDWCKLSEERRPIIEESKTERDHLRTVVQKQYAEKQRHAEKHARKHA